MTSPYELGWDAIRAAGLAEDQYAEEVALLVADFAVREGIHALELLARHATRIRKVIEDAEPTPVRPANDTQWKV